MNNSLLIHSQCSFHNFRAFILHRWNKFAQILMPAIPLMPSFRNQKTFFEKLQTKGNKTL